MICQQGNQQNGQKQNTPHLDGLLFEKVVFDIMVARRPECPLVLYPHSGRRRGGDIACAVTYDVKARRKKASVCAPAGALVIMCIVSDPTRIVFPFQQQLMQSVYSPQLLRRVEVIGDFCPVAAEQVALYPQPFIINGQRFVGGKGIVIGNNFVPFREEKCPRFI